MAFQRIRVATSENANPSNRSSVLRSHRDTNEVTTIVTTKLKAMMTPDGCINVVTAVIARKKPHDNKMAPRSANATISDAGDATHQDLQPRQPPRSARAHSSHRPIAES